MAIPRVSDPMAVARTVTRLAVVGLALAALGCILWLGRMEAPPPPAPAPARSTTVVAPPKAPAVQTPRRAQYPAAGAKGPTGTGVVTPSPALAPGVGPL